MPIFSYQSFNSSPSTTHDLESISGQRFTVSAHNYWAKQRRAALVYPTLPDEDGDDPPQAGAVVTGRHGLPVEGPANLLNVKVEGPGALNANAEGRAVFYRMMQQKVLQSRQGVFREMGKMPQVVAFGEFDGAHADFQTMTQMFDGGMSGASAHPQACHNFSVYCSDGTTVDRVGQGDGWYAIHYLGYTVVFVHVPNSLMDAPKNPAATKPKPGPVRGLAAQHQVKAAAPKPYSKPIVGIGGRAREGLIGFYRNISNTILQNGGGVIDVIMGDTNQKSDTWTPDIVSAATNLTFRNAHNNRNIQPIDTHEFSAGGTNANATMMYDVAVYNTQTVTMAQMCYWSQLAPIGDGGRVAAVTDHMGLAIKVE